MVNLIFLVIGELPMQIIVKETRFQKLAYFAYKTKKDANTIINTHTHTNIMYIETEKFYVCVYSIKKILEKYNYALVFVSLIYFLLLNKSDACKLINELFKIMGFRKLSIQKEPNGKTL